MKATIFLTYSDDSEVSFDFKSDESETSALALLMMVCRGTFMASMACKVVAYNEEGFEICAYIK